MNGNVLGEWIHDSLPKLLVTRASLHLGKIWKLLAHVLARQFTEEQSIWPVSTPYNVQLARLIIREMQIKSTICCFMAYPTGKDEKVTKAIVGTSLGTRTQSSTCGNVSWEIIKNVFTDAFSSVSF